MNAWEQVKTELRSRLGDERYEAWLARTAFRSLDDGNLRVRVPDPATARFLEGECSTLVASAARRMLLPVSRVIYDVEPSGPVFTPSPVAAPPEGMQGGFFANGSLNPKFTFETFVVGSCNQFAHAAAKAVATVPSRSYNPLFIYGGVGMGKTHLMHAIGRELHRNYASMRIVYTSSERFMNEMIQCISMQRMSHFHQHYRNADVLLVDDVQILGGKERTQEEFFHTFNELYDHQKQIVVSSDSSPKDIPGLVERLRSRFEWGLMVDIQPPDLETKMAILDKKAEAEGVRLPNDVRILIATKTRSNVRELEGALVKLIAYASVVGSPISLAMAQHCLRQLGPNNERRTTIESVQRAVAEHFRLQVNQLKTKSNARSIAVPRQVAMYLVRELTGSSFPEIGRAFGGKHHTTVLHSVQKIERLRHTDPEINRSIHKLIDSMG
ncbi:MAG: chromosomal replication initiator protein DnaA [Bryobacterales bacterium]|nr:chromosomal replication initiator protein DnaA [Bryobacterales bacterium]